MKNNRRDFLKILGIGSAAGMAGCSKTPPDELQPYVVPPEEMVRGRAIWFRTTCRECPAGCGVEARVREGRVHKVEGNPEHPVNGGGLCARGQAAVQGLYNADRLRTPLVRDGSGKLRAATWEQAEKAALEGLGRAGQVQVVTGASRGALEDLIRSWPGAQHITYEPIAYESIKEANRRCFGIAGLPVLRFAEAKRILLAGADVLETYVSPVGYAQGIQAARRHGARIEYFGPRLSLTAARADIWHPCDEAKAARMLLDQAGAAKRESAIAVAGDNLTSAMAANRYNQAAGAIGRTVRFDRSSALDQARAKLQIAERAAVVVLDSNPVYSSPEALKNARFVVCLSPYQTETTEVANAVFPIHSPLESWGDYEPWAGIHCLQQPAMMPVYDTREAGDILIRLGKLREPRFADFLKARWRKLHAAEGGKQDFEAFWREALVRGGLWTDVPERKISSQSAEAGAPEPAARGRFRLITYPSLAFFDGRSANRSWLQELPDPITQAVWDSPIEINPEDASQLGIQSGNRVEVRGTGGTIQMAAYVYPGVLAGHVAVPLGQGHTAFGRSANGAGANGFLLGEGPVDVRRLSQAKELVTVGGSSYQFDRGIARSRVVPAPAEEPERHAHPEVSLYPAHQHDGYRWGMVIDLDACTGCGACTVACYAENNIPVVGKDRVASGRIMSWIRMERFLGPGEPGSPLQVDWTMVLCQHCDNAPCEPVCPVFAAYHNKEGLNGQVYNRCVGTRYCANNCPYRVRRFNWFEYERPAPEEWQLNPDVTVRTKGVMEKCTFCIQRIVEAKDRARSEGRKIRDGEVSPACAQSCPTNAIAFGNLDDPDSRVAQLSRDGRRYKILEELNTRPAVTYLERERRKV